MHPLYIVLLMALRIIINIAYISFKQYKQIILYLLKDKEFLKDLSELIQRYIKKKVINYKLIDGAFKFQEGLGMYLICILKEKILTALKYTYNYYNYFAIAFILYNLKGEIQQPFYYLNMEYYIKGYIIY